jgi:DNA-binding NtrC family response regulator
MTVSASVKRILIVDDNEVVLDILREFLSPAYAVDAAATVTAAVERITAAPPDAILLDVRLPGTDGLSLLGSLRRAGITVPIFVITGYDSVDLAEEATRRGATGYLVKPVDLRRLDRLIADTLGVLPLLNK